MYKQRISFFVFVFALLLLHQVSCAERRRYQPLRPYGKRSFTRGRFLKVWCNGFAFLLNRFSFFLACNIVQFMFLVFIRLYFMSNSTAVCPDILSNVFNIAIPSGRARM